MSGKYYNGAIYVHKAMFEALERMRFHCFLNSVSEDNKSSIKWFIEEYHNTCLKSPKGHEEVTNSFMLNGIWKMYNEFIQTNCAKNATFEYWSSYIDMIGKFHN